MRQLNAIVSKSKYPRTKELWDLFLFSTYAQGLRFSDICTLRWCEINWENRMIHHLQVKNHTRNAKWLTIRLNDGAMEILERWKGKYDNFIFGQLDDEFDLSNCELLKMTCNSRNKSINTSLDVSVKKQSFHSIYIFTLPDIHLEQLH